MRYRMWIGVVLVWGGACAVESPPEETARSVEASVAVISEGLASTSPNSYIGLTVPAAQPTLLLPRILAEEQIEHGGVFSPDGTIFLYTVSDPQYTAFKIMVMRRQDETWTPPQTAPFSGQFSDHGAFFSPTADQLLLSSMRPLPGTGEASTWHLWSLSFEGRSWSKPTWLHLPGIEERWQSHASMTQDGVLYFHALSSSDEMDFDLYRTAPLEDGGYGPPAPLGPAINSAGVEVTGWVAADERFLLFAAYDRADGYGLGDLYISRRGEQGEWGIARNLGPSINTEFEESNPTLTPDGNYLIFSSGRPLPEPHRGKPGLHLYWVRADVLQPPMP